jgi:hypothetical protein
LTYSKFALHLDNIINGDQSVQLLAKNQTRIETCDANWFNFATWGTVTITRNIANERAPQRLASVSSLSLRRRLTPAVIRERAADGQRVSRALAWGQRLIFLTSSLAMVDFSRHIDDRGADTQFALDAQTRKDIERLSEVFPGFRRPGTSAIGPQRHLVGIETAFNLYRLAKLEDADRGVRSRLILHANVLLTAMEQDLANDAVRAVIDHVPQRVLTRLDRRIARTAERWTSVPRQIVELELPFQTVSLRGVIDSAWSRLMTDQVLVMALPTETLRLGRDVPPKDPGQPMYPWPLRHLDRWPMDPTVLSGRQADLLADGGRRDHETRDRLLRVAEVIASFDRTGPNGSGSAAQDWRRFDDRMNWAVTLMRSRQCDETLFWPPYAREDEARIVCSELPRRSGDPTELEVQAPLDPFAAEGV